VKILFLDMDGVLNSMEFMKRRNQESTCHEDRWVNNVDPLAVARLNRIVAETGALIVISSTWRKLCDCQEMQRILEIHGFTGHVVGETPDFGKRRWYGAGVGNCYTRGHEIREWFNEHPLGMHSRVASFVPSRSSKEPVESFVILDDSSDMATVHERHVWCDCAVGLTDVESDYAIRMLQGASS
jgi:hypothetical protein